MIEKRPTDDLWHQPYRNSKAVLLTEIGLKLIRMADTSGQRQRSLKELTRGLLYQNPSPQHLLMEKKANDGTK